MTFKMTGHATKNRSFYGYEAIVDSGSMYFYLQNVYFFKAICTVNTLR